MSLSARTTRAPQSHSEGHSAPASAPAAVQAAPAPKTARSGFYAAGPALSLGVQAQLDEELPLQQQPEAVEQSDEFDAPPGDEGLPLQQRRADDGEHDGDREGGLLREAQPGSAGAIPATAVMPVAARGLGAAAQPLPGLASVQHSFGRHSLTDVRVQVGGPAREASEQLGARAYTRGNRIAFKETPDLKLAAHEATHVVQQRRGVQLKGGISAPGDPYERQADRVAEAVQAGRSAEPLLDEQPHRASAAVQRCACGGAGCAACAQARGDEEGEEQPIQAKLEVTASRLYEPGAAPITAGEGVTEQAEGAPGDASAPATAGPAGATPAGEGAAGSADEAAVTPSAPGGRGGAAGPDGPAQPQGGALAAAAQSDAATGAPARGQAASASGGRASPQVSGTGATGSVGGAGAGTTGPAEVAGGGAGPASAGAAPARPTGGGAGPASAGAASTSGAVGQTGGRQSAVTGAGEPACQSGAGAAKCYRAGIEEPEREPKDDPVEPPATEAEERMRSESPEVQPNDACPVEAAVEAQAPAQGAALQSAAAPAAPAGAAGSAGRATAGQPGGAETAPAGAPGAEGPAAAGAPDGQGAATDEAALGGSAGEGGPAANPLDAAIATGEVQRDGAITAFQVSSTRLHGADDGIRGIDRELDFAPAGGDASERGQRDLARNRANSFFREAAGQMEQVVGLARDQVPDELGGLAETVKAGLGSQIEREKLAISKRISSAEFRAQASAALARSQVNAAHTSTLAAIHAATEQARVQLTADHVGALAETSVKETAGLSAVNAAYVKSRGEHEQVGTRIGQQAITIGEGYHRGYNACKIEGKDSFSAGYLTNRRAEAQQNAAREVAKGYKKSLEQTAKDQARQLIKGRPKDRCAIIAQARKARETLDNQIKALTGALDAGREQAIAQADARRDGLLGSISSSLRSTLHALSSQEQTQRQAANDTGYLQQVSIEQGAHAAAAALQGSVAEVMDGIQGGLQSARAMLAGAPAPDPEELAKLLGQQVGKLAGGLSRLKAQVSLGGVAAGLRLSTSGASGAEALTQVTTANDTQADAVGSGFARSMQALGVGARSAFQQQATQYRQQARAAATDGGAALKGVVTGLQTSIKTTTDSIARSLGDSKTRLEESLRESLSGIHCEIPRRANQAAAKEQPAWKTVVAVILIIAVIIVVALVIGPAVIGLVGAAAGALGASAGAAAVIGTIVGGAIVGAATSATIQVLNNWRTGERLSAGVGRAALIGALGGAFGAGAGALIGKYVASGALQFAANIAADAVLDVATQLATTGTVSLGDFAQGLATSLATGGFGSFSRVRGIQARVQYRAARVVPGAGAARFAQSIRPSGPAETGPAPRPAAEVETTPPPRPAAESEAQPGVRPAAEPETGPAPRPTAETEAGSAPRSQAPRSEADVATTAKQAESGSPPRPGSGDTPRLDAEPGRPANQRTDAELSEAATPARVGDTDHAVLPRRIGNETRLFGCSGACDPITAKLGAMLDVPSIDPKLRSRLEKLRTDIEGLEGRIQRGEVSSRQIVEETGRVAARLREIGTAHPELGKALNAPATAGASDVQIRQGHAQDWAVDPVNGKFDPNGKMQGLPPEHVDQLAQRQAPASGEPRPVFRRRRHRADRRANNARPMPMKEWAESGFQANVNRDVSSPHENAALAAVGATANNRAGQGFTYSHSERVDVRGYPTRRTRGSVVGQRTMETRPDGTRPNQQGGRDVVEHKHLTGNTTVLHDTQQLRAQRQMARKLNGEHELVLSSDRGLMNGVPNVKPSSGVSARTGTIYYYEPTLGRVTHSWNGTEWTPIRLKKGG